MRKISYFLTMIVFFAIVSVSCASKKPVSTVNVHWGTSLGSIDTNFGMKKKHGKQKIVGGTYNVNFKNDSIGNVSVGGDLKNGGVNVNVDNGK